jgi:hypothetical protein
MMLSSDLLSVSVNGSVAIHVGFGLYRLSSSVGLFKESSNVDQGDINYHIIAFKVLFYFYFYSFSSF